MQDFLFDLKHKDAELKLCLRGVNTISVTGLTAFARSVVLSRILELSGRKVLFITSSEQAALKYKNDLSKLFNYESAILPYQNISPYEDLGSNFYDYSKQIEVLNSGENIVIVPVKALLEKFPTPDFFKKNSISLKVGDELDLKSFAQKLVALGYKRATMVSDVSEFSIRGDIVDVYSLDENPIRVELWGDEIVDIRYFNNETQKSIQKCQDCKILPIYKFIVEDKSADELKRIVLSGIKTEGENDLASSLLAKIEEGYFEGVEVYQSYFNPDLISVFDYFKDYIIVFDEMSEIFSKYEQISQNYFSQMQENLKLGLICELAAKNHFEFDEFSRFIERFVKFGLNNFIDFETDCCIEFDSHSAKVSYSSPVELAEFLKSHQNYNLLVATDYPQRVRDLFSQYEIYNYEIIENLSCAGCILEDYKLILITDRELFNKKAKEITASKRTYYKEKPDYIDNINDIKEGDFVVHSVHGVGVYLGLSQQEFDGQLKDYLSIEYANKDKLHMPAEQINLLCRYRGSGTLRPKLSRMGGNDWTNTKQKVKKEVEKIAYDLLKLNAKRKMQEGIVFASDTPWQAEMEEAFEFVETPDQMRSIEEIKADMESLTPMDRLVCGDVGYGKTEVAMRGLFKAVASGYQAAVIVPTTILAMQHFQTIQERFKPFAMDVQLLSRFRSTKEQKQTLKDIEAGSCDVVVATHRLLQDDVRFKKLGMLVIDEEHRFGVRHKEKLKQLKENIDIISMSATPIPRTLYMSLSGIKDMSVINTPPKNRLPIKTFVGGFDESTIKNAITHELDRDGQVFYLYNRVETIDEFRMKLQKLLPHARIAIGHAQMDEKALEQVMIDFANKEYDILLCTTIIESGLDIPNANTILIHDADKFGLAQLYQLRGRVGRCERQAYCYCFYKKGKALTKEALQRLSAIKEFTTLGSGYQIALRDIEIRGVGNILGTKQHGHMVNVGFDTYCELLDETVSELRGESVESVIPSVIDINVTAYIPDEWVGSSEQKMIEYKRLSDVTNQLELDKIIDEWKDRFAKPPECVINLINLIKLRLQATMAKISLVRETPDNIRIYTPYSQIEWDIIKKALPSNITKYIKFTMAPKSCSEGTSVILFDNSHMNFNEIFNMLSDLFYYIYKISHEYTN